MTSKVKTITSSLHEVELNFADEGVTLKVSRNVSGSHNTALAYIPTMERDARANYAELFPLPVYEESEMEGELL